MRIRVNGIFLGALLSILILPAFVNALIINEIMYDLPGSDSDREWIEIYNDGSEINLTGWKFYESGTNHGLSLVNGSFILSSGDYAIIIDDASAFFLDYPSFNGNVFDSSFSLSNSGEDLALKNSSLDIVVSLTYSSSSGASGNNYSLQWNGSSFCEGDPTPGAQNSCAVIVNSNNQSENNSSGQNQTNTSNCENVTVVEIVDYPNSLRYGTSRKLEVRFDATCYNFASVKFLVYGESSRVISYENGSKIKKYASCQEGTLFENFDEEVHKWKIPFNTYPNCDDQYEEGNQTISLRVCKPSWEEYYEEDLEIYFSGENSDVCPEKVGETKIAEEGTAQIKENSSKSITNNVSKEEKYSIKEEVIYESKDTDMKKIAIYLLILLFLLLAIYVLVNKGKV